MQKLKKHYFIAKKQFISTKPQNGAGETKTEVKRKNATDLNIQDRITKFHDMLRGDHVYRVPLKYFTDIRKINFPLRIDLRLKLHLETEMKKLFQLMEQQQLILMQK